MEALRTNPRWTRSRKATVAAFAFCFAIGVGDLSAQDDMALFAIRPNAVGMSFDLIGYMLGNIPFSFRYQRWLGGVGLEGALGAGQLEPASSDGDSLSALFSLGLMVRAAEGVLDDSGSTYGAFYGVLRAGTFKTRDASTMLNDELSVPPFHWAPMLGVGLGAEIVFCKRLSLPVEIGLQYIHDAGDLLWPFLVAAVAWRL